MGERGHEANQILGVGRPERAIHFIKCKKRERVQRGANVHFLFPYYLLLAVTTQSISYYKKILLLHFWARSEGN